jgi:FMN-dependent NADH-azoreductase
MTRLLHIQSSSNLATSTTRKLSDAFVADYARHHSGSDVTLRDLVTTPVPHLGVDLLGGLFGQPESLTPEQQTALRLSDDLIDELAAADLLVLAAPMYTFSIPSALKAWIDHVVRAGRSFQYTAEGPRGLMTGKRAVLFLASGGVYSAGPYKAMDFQETYLRGILGFIGITDVEVVRAEGLAMGADAAAKAVAAAQDEGLRLAA